jgi:regulator of sigma E protease
VTNALISVLALLVVLGVLVFVHELGHFVAAKWAGIRVFRFALGMGNPVRRLTVKRGHTEYAICWLPLGGYVKMASREEMDTDPLQGGDASLANVPPEETFESKPVWKRMVVILAGVAMNVLFAWGAYSLVFHRQGRPVNPTVTVGLVVDTALPPGAGGLAALQPGDSLVAVGGRPVRTWDDVLEGIRAAPGDSVVFEAAGRPPVVALVHPDAVGDRIRMAGAVFPALLPVIGEVVPGRAAAEAGLASGDTVLAVDGQPIAQWYDLTAILEASPGRPLTLTVGRAGGRRPVPITPATETVPGPAGEVREVGRIGVYVQGPDLRYEPLSVVQAVREGGRLTLVTSTFIVRVVRGMLTGRVSTREVAGPISIAQMASTSARQGFDDFLMFMGLISVNLAIVNLLPIPILDGGQFLFLLGEAVLRRPLPLRLRRGLTAAGLLMVGLLMVLAFSNDIARLLGR